MSSAQDRSTLADRRKAQGPPKDHVATDGEKRIEADGKDLEQHLRASSYEPGNRAGSVTGMNFVFCSYGKF